MANNETGNDHAASPQYEASPPKRGLMSGLKAIVKQVRNTWSRSSQPETKQQPVAGSMNAGQIPPAYVAREQKQEQLREQLREKMRTLDKQQTARKEAAEIAKATASIKLDYAHQIPQAYVPHEKNQEWQREKMRTLNEQLANKGREIKETRPSGEIMYTRKQLPIATIHSSKSGRPHVSKQPPVPPLPPLEAIVSSERNADTRSVLARSPSSSTINSTTSSIFSRASASTTASSIADEPPPGPSPVAGPRMAQAISMKSVEFNKATLVDIPSSTAKKDAITRPSPTDLSRAEDNRKSSQRPPLDLRIRPKGHSL